MPIDLKAFLQMGVRPELPHYVQKKVKASNVVGIALMVIAITYWIISAVFNPELNFIPIIGVVVVIGAGVLNIIGFTTISRLLLAIVPTSLAMVYQAYLVQPGEDTLAGLMLLALSFSTLPFILFDLREGGYVYVPVAICFVLMTSFPILRDALVMPLDDTVYRNGLLYHITVAIAFAFSFINVLTLSYINMQSNKEAQGLLEVAEEQNRLMHDKEKEMEENLAALQQAQEEEKRRSWASEGFSRFGALLRRQDDEQQMYDALLAGIIKYIDVNQGGLYLAEGEGKDVELVLRSAYAYDRKKYRTHQLKPGQGLLGQCYLEKDYVYLTDVPSKYVAITSGLGDATPTALLLIPLMAEDEAMGVLELASFKPFPKHIIEFLMKLGQDIAATVHISRTNQLTRQLLEQAQLQTEQMRAQEEEMRQNMEELSATQEELQRKEREYMRQITMLEARMQGQVQEN